MSRMRKPGALSTNPRRPIQATALRSIAAWEPLLHAKKPRQFAWTPPRSFGDNKNHYIKINQIALILWLPGRGDRAIPVVESIQVSEVFVMGLPIVPLLVGAAAGAAVTYLLKDDASRSRIKAGAERVGKGFRRGPSEESRVSEAREVEGEVVGVGEEDGAPAGERAP